MIDNLKDVIENHKKWATGKGGEWADMQEADLRGANLQGAYLRGANLQRADLQRADLQGADLRGADLQGAYLQRADLRRADLRGADLDYSCMPLWCGGARFKCDDRLIYQLLAHICTLDAPIIEELKPILMPYARQSHRYADLFKEENA